ncbi:uncharacterized protein LOC111373815 [Olea europaea var. sylvestris]|uniref:uncharacterized protein LOC111373815 n=1 Tax=Olea europaea var. sylvestris TaxID=158386 RepID=UPI000C1D7182|nr:uncharacterized protein LOC111373815 [Olea europaea var. sylvestris]
MTRFFKPHKIRHFLRHNQLVWQFTGWCLPGSGFGKDFQLNFEIRIIKIQEKKLEMDLWIVAAAAGAGYIASNWQNFSAEKEGLAEPTSKISLRSESRNLLQQIRDRTCPMRRLARKKAQKDVISEESNDKDVNLLEMDRLNGGNSVAEIASSSSGSAFENIEGHEDHSGAWLTKLSPVHIVGESYVENSGCDCAESCNFHRFSKNKLIRMCCGYSMRSLNPSEMPAFVTDGRQIIRSLSNDLPVVEVEQGKEGARRENGAFLKGNDSSMTSSSLKQFESAVIQRKPEKCPDLSRPSDSRDRASSRTFHSPGHDQMLLFFVGMTIGIISATMASKNEIENLNEQMKQTHNLVQDLHEELDHRSYGTDDPSLLIREPVASCSEMETNELIRVDNLKANDKETENSELRSKIEAELEAELERLEHNLKASNLERISTVVDLDPDFEPYTMQGDLKLAVSSENYDYASESGRDGTKTATDCSQPINYAVSPRELSLRLHELIESRLEAHIKELEIALEYSENGAQTLRS